MLGIEHNLDALKNAGSIIDLGQRIVAASYCRQHQPVSRSMADRNPGTRQTKDAGSSVELPASGVARPCSLVQETFAPGVRVQHGANIAERIQIKIFGVEVVDRRGRRGDALRIEGVLGRLWLERVQQLTRRRQ